MAARMYWVLRSDGDVTGMEAAIRRTVREVDPDVAASSILPLEEIRAASLRTRRIHLRLLSVFGLAALAVAAIGVYGISAVSVRARQRELAIRAVFGASRGEIVRLVFREELQPALLALSGGLLAALGVARMLAGPLFRTSPTDPAVYRRRRVAGGDCRSLISSCSEGRRHRPGTRASSVVSPLP